MPNPRCYLLTQVIPKWSWKGLPFKMGHFSCNHQDSESPFQSQCAWTNRFPGVPFSYFNHPCWPQSYQVLPSLSHFLIRCSKRRTIEKMKRSHTVEQLLNLVGKGRIDISCATDVARAILDDGVQHESINKVASLGCYGSSQSNAERDLHRWLKNHFGLCLQPYTVQLPLKATKRDNGVSFL